MPFDTFDRGSYPATPLGTSTSGDTWGVIRGGFQILNDGGDSYAEGTTVNRNVATFDYGSADATIFGRFATLAGDGNAGLAFRVVNNDNYYFAGDGTIVKRVAGVDTGLGVGYDGFSTGGGPPTCLKVVLSGSNIKLYRDCELVEDFNDSSLSATKHGIYSRFASGHIYDFGIACLCGGGWHKRVSFG